MPLAFREAGDPTHPVALLLHGYPSSSYVWHAVMPAIADAGWRAVAPDFAGYGDSAPLDGRAATWEEHVRCLDDFVAEHELAPVALVVHDWGGLIGLRWALERPYAVCALAIMSTGFFPDGKWHGLARALRTAGEGERLLDGLTRATFGELLRSASPHVTEGALDQYWKGYADPRRRAAHLDLYRSGDFGKLAGTGGALAALDVPTLLLWGADDAFAPVAGAHRFQREIPHAELVVLPGAGHFPQEDAPDEVAAHLSAFLRRVRTE